jgi:hypothetical protein
VKKLLSRPHFLIVVLLHCIFFCAGSIHVHASPDLVVSIKKEPCPSSSSVKSPDTYCNPFNVPGPCGTIITAGFKNNHTGFLDFSSLKQQDIRFNFPGYIFHSRYLLIRLLKSDIIFPFHYFW